MPGIAHEADFVVAQAMRLAATSSVAILVRDRINDEPFIAQRLPSDAIRLHRKITAGWSTAPGIRYGTYHSAKGLEFDRVLLPFCGADRLPDPEVAAAFGPERDGARWSPSLRRGHARSH